MISFSVHLLGSQSAAPKEMPAIELIGQHVLSLSSKECRIVVLGKWN